MERPNLHALLVGVSTNLYSKSKLNGCENDVSQMIRCLEDFSLGYFEEMNFNSLLNEQAPRAAVVDAFQQKLILPAKPGDVAIFYFSGHGGQELAPPELTPYEVDGKLEGIVCYDSHVKGGPKLIDKELR